MKRIKKPLFILPILVFVFGCGDNSNNVVDNIVNQVTEADSNIVEEDEDAMEYYIPSPLQIAMTFNRYGMPYDEKLLNPVDNLNLYQSRLSKYLNFGGYSADMSYAVLNDRSDKALDYLNVVLKLSDDLGFSSVFGSDELMNKFKNNMNDQEVLSDILTEIQEDLELYLEDEHNQFTHAVIFTGAWIESVDIGVSVETKDDQISKKVIEQMNLLNFIIKELAKNPDKMEGIDELISELTEINTIYEGFSNFNQIQEAEDLDGIVFSREEIDKLGKKIIELRTKIVNNK